LPHVEVDVSPAQLIVAELHSPLTNAAALLSLNTLAFGFDTLPLGLVISRA